MGRGTGGQGVVAVLVASQDCGEGGISVALAGEEAIAPEHVAEAIRYQILDRGARR